MGRYIARKERLFQRWLEEGRWDEEPFHEYVARVDAAEEEDPDVSIGRKIPFEEAYEVARLLTAQLRPHVRRCKVAGSLRRRRREVRDLEIVVEPHFSPDLLGNEEPQLEMVRALVREWGDVLQEGPRKIKVRLRDRDLTVELYLVHPPAQWGSILAIRTGPASLGHFAMIRFQERGLVHRDGHLEDGDGNLIPTPTEEEFFRQAGLPCLPPARRESDDAKRPLEEKP